MPKAEALNADLDLIMKYPTKLKMKSLKNKKTPTVLQLV